MERLKKLTRRHIHSLKPYSSARDDFKGVAEVYLDANENSFGSLGQLGLHRYPDPHQEKLKKRLAEIKNIDAANIFLGNGSDEAIDLLIRAFCEPDEDQVVLFPPTYGMYQVCADINNVRTKSILLNSAFQIDLEILGSKWEPKDKLAFICSPNNPSGNLIENKSILKLIESFPGLVVVDEAYIDFANQPSLIDKLNEFSNLVILQTFSKALGLAAIRLGAAYAHPFVINSLNTIKPPYNINHESQRIGLEALMHVSHKAETVEKIIAEREKLSKDISKFDCVEKVLPSHANFLLVRFNNHQKVNEYLRRNGLIVRDRSKEPHCENCLRITVGTEEENRKLLALFENFK